MVSIVRLLGSIPYHGTGRICEICNTQAKKFRPFGNPPRAEAQYWKCHSLERHRFLWHYLTIETDLLRRQGQKMLHVAPESCLQQKFRNYIGKSYLTADLFADNVDLKMDITDIQFPEHYFEAIYCSHVLEHVPDDRKAMRELYRVLKPEGWAILLVPIAAAKTFEDDTIESSEARLKAFGQEDHVRIYGPDYEDRLQEAGFKVKKISPTDILDDEKITILGLGVESGDIFLCRK